MIKLPLEWTQRNIRIAVVGCGGTGSELVAKLFKMDYLLQKLGGEPLEVTLFDPKKVTPYNVGRQNFWECDIGLYKSQLLAERYNNFGGSFWEGVIGEFEIDDVNYYDIIISCVDKASVRAMIGESARQWDDTIWIDGGNDDSSGQVVMGHLWGNGKDKVPNVYNLYPSLKDMEDNDRPSCSHEESIARQDFGINGAIADAMVQMLWQLLRYGKVENHIAHIDLKSIDVTSMKACEENWSLLGYIREQKEVA